MEHKWDTKLEHVIVDVDPAELLANPGNARRHPEAQQTALKASLDEVGWVAPVIVNRRTGHILDGHARVEQAIESESLVPVAYVDLDPGKEPYVLATYDAVALMADYDQQDLTDLLIRIETTGADELDNLLAGIADVDLGAGFEYLSQVDETPTPPPPTVLEPETNEPLQLSGSGVKSIILTYSSDVYAEVMGKLAAVEGETNADKLLTLLGGSE